ncbi:MAG: hypothetical protein QW231_03370 [Candidatus Bathyarchaeia archaeon]
MPSILQVNTVLMIPRFLPERFNQRARRHIREYAASKAVAISFHGPSDNLNLRTLHPEIRKAVINCMKLCLDFASNVEAERRGAYLPDYWPLYKSALKESLREISEYVIGGVMVCYENALFDENAVRSLNIIKHMALVTSRRFIEGGYIAFIKRKPLNPRRVTSQTYVRQMSL